MGGGGLCYRYTLYENAGKLDIVCTVLRRGKKKVKFLFSVCFAESVADPRSDLLLKLLALLIGKMCLTLMLGLSSIAPSHGYFIIISDTFTIVTCTVHVVGLSVAAAFEPVINMEHEVIIGGFKCLYWLLKHEIAHHTNYGALLDLAKLLGCDYFSKLQLNKSLIN